MIYVPPNTIHQHFNADPDRPLRLISTINRIFKQCGLNDLEQIEDAPEYDPGVEPDARADPRVPARQGLTGGARPRARPLPLFRARAAPQRIRPRP